MLADVDSSYIRELTDKDDSLTRPTFVLVKLHAKVNMYLKIQCVIFFFYIESMQVSLQSNQNQF